MMKVPVRYLVGVSTDHSRLFLKSVYGEEADSPLAVTKSNSIHSNRGQIIAGLLLLISLYYYYLAADFDRPQAAEDLVTGSKCSLILAPQELGVWPDDPDGTGGTCGSSTPERGSRRAPHC